MAIPHWPHYTFKKKWRTMETAFKLKHLFPLLAMTAWLNCFKVLLRVTEGYIVKVMWSSQSNELCDKYAWNLHQIPEHLKHQQSHYAWIWSKAPVLLTVLSYLIESVISRECSCVPCDPWRWSSKVLDIYLMIRRLRNKLTMWRITHEAKTRRM